VPSSPASPSVLKEALGGRAEETVSLGGGLLLLRRHRENRLIAGSRCASSVVWRHCGVVHGVRATRNQQAAMVSLRHRAASGFAAFHPLAHTAPPARPIRLRATPAGRGGWPLSSSRAGGSGPAAGRKTLRNCSSAHLAPQQHVEREGIANMQQGFPTARSLAHGPTGGGFLGEARRG